MGIQILKAAVLLSLLSCWVFGLYCCHKAVDRLVQQVARIRESRKQSFPEDELHPYLTHQDTPHKERQWVALDHARSVAAGLPDPEDERQYPYYNRTGQVICQLHRRSVDDIMTGRWYHYDEWMQDIIAGTATGVDCELPDTTAEERD